LLKEEKSARNEIRTRMSLRTPPPQDGMSTNFTTRALFKTTMQFLIAGSKSNFFKQ